MTFNGDASPSEGRSIPRIVVVMSHYLPGEKAGGPVQTVANLVELLGDDFDFRVVTSDRDHLESTPYPGIHKDRWNEVGRAQVLYLPPEVLNSKTLRDVIEAQDPDLIHVNSILARQSVRLLLWNRLGKISAPVLMAPRGETSPGATALHRVRKILYFTFIRLIQATRNVTWHASTSAEERDIRSRLGPRLEIFTAADPVHPPLLAPLQGHKQPGSVRFVFLSRVSPMKNLVFFIDLLSRSEGDLVLDVYGPQEDAYIQAVKDAIARTPDNVSVSLHPPVAHDHIDEVLGNGHFFVLPTLGENFGHAIWESLRVGRPALLSDTTPWRGLTSAGAGWDLDLGDEPAWMDAIRQCVDADQAEWDLMSDRALGYATEWYRNSDFAEAHAVMFREAMADQK